MGFVAQLDLGEINKDRATDWLPSRGRLLFFYEQEDGPWGFDPEDKGSWAVIFENGDDEPHSLDLPPDLDEELPAKYVSAVQFVSYPDAQRLDFDEAGLSEDDDYEDYYDFIDENYGDDPRHQIDGFPNPIQGDNMETECQLASGGVYCGDPEGYNSEKARELAKEKNDWKLLFQFDSDDDIRTMWGDMGMLYFWVRESEARNGDFSNSWMILQCS